MSTRWSSSGERLGLRAGQHADGGHRKLPLYARDQHEFLGDGNDKAKVEVGVQIADRWIMASLRHRRFHSLGELNEAVQDLLKRLNQRPFKKREGPRPSAFAVEERNALAHYDSSTTKSQSGNRLA